VKERLAQKISITPNLSTILTGHGRLRTYFFNFKVIGNPVCSFNEGEETVEHVIFSCSKFKTEREIMKTAVAKTGQSWPVAERELIRRFKTRFTTFVNSIDLKA
jgi:hypothetical protein